MPSIEDRLQEVRDRIDRAARNYGRDPAPITLLGVSKKQSSKHIRDAAEAGLVNVGENYLQEALDKLDTLRDLPICWHFIGPIQSNKCKAIAENFSWVHSVDRLKIAQKLNQNRRAELGKLKILLQINIDSEDSKSGFTLDKLDDTVSEIRRLDMLELKGLMVIPKPRSGTEEQRQPFRDTRILLETLNQKYKLDMNTLSMGMSNDLEAAIAEGATIVRIGTALFGERPRETKS